MLLLIVPAGVFFILPYLLSLFHGYLSKAAEGLIRLSFGVSIFAVILFLITRLPEKKRSKATRILFWPLDRWLHDVD